MLQTIVRRPRAAEDIAQGERLAKMVHRDIGPTDVARVFNAAGLNYVLVGGHAANGYTGRPRATVDVEVIVENPKKAAVAIAKAFPNLTATDTPVVTRFKRADGEEAIDLMKPIGSKLWKKLLKTFKTIDIDGIDVNVPTVEGMLAAKLAAMTSPARKRPDKMIDGADFLRIIEANSKINLKFLEELGELVYPGGGAEILKLLADARAGKPLKF